MKTLLSLFACLGMVLLCSVSCDTQEEKKNDTPVAPIENNIDKKGGLPENNVVSDNTLALEEVTLPRNNKTTPEGWCDDLNAALAAARKQNKNVMVLFTGSDWCGWCKKLKKDTLSGAKFQEFAARNLVLVYIDIPRKGLTETQLQKNQDLMERLCGEQSGFPTTVILDYGGKKLGDFAGYLKEDEYIQSIADVLPAK